MKARFASWFAEALVVVTVVAVINKTATRKLAEIECMDDALSSFFLSF